MEKSGENLDFPSIPKPPGHEEFVLIQACFRDARPLPFKKMRKAVEIALNRTRI